VNSTLKSVLFWVVLVVTLALIWNFSSQFPGSSVEVSYDKFLDKVEAGDVSEVTFTGNEIVGKYNTTSADTAAKGFYTYVPPQAEGLTNKLR